MESQMSQNFISDELQDKVFVFKISKDPSLSEKVKKVEIPEVFTPLKEFSKHQLQVCKSFIVNFKVNSTKQAILKQEKFLFCLKDSFFIVFIKKIVFNHFLCTR